MNDSRAKRDFQDRSATGYTPDRGPTSSMFNSPYEGNTLTLPTETLATASNTVNHATTGLQIPGSALGGSFALHAGDSQEISALAARMVSMKSQDAHPWTPDETPIIAWEMEARGFPVQGTHQPAAQQDLATSIPPEGDRYVYPWPSPATANITANSPWDLATTVPSRSVTQSHQLQEMLDGEKASTESRYRYGPSESWSNSAVPPASSETQASNSGSASPSPEPEASDRLERFFLQIISEAKKLGYTTIDQMVTHYYIADFDEKSSIFFAQKLSRTRHLRELLRVLRKASTTWTCRETQGFNDEIVKAAEHIYSSEIGVLRSVLGGPAGENGKKNERDGAVHELLKEFQGLTLKASIKTEVLGKRELLQDAAPELWSLLTELAHAAGFQEATVSEFACTIILLLSNLHPPQEQ